MYLNNKIESLAFIPYKKNKIKVLIITKNKILDDIVIRLELIKEKENKYRPFRIWYKEKGIQNFIQYKEFFMILRNIKKVFIPYIYKNELKNIIQMLKDFQIKFEVKEICRYCMNNNKLTILDLYNSYIFYNELICEECALTEIKNEFKFINFSPTPHFIENVNKLLKNFRDVNKIINILRPGFIAAKSSDFTIYDVLKPKEIGLDIPKYEIDDLNIPEKFRYILKKLEIKFLPVQNLAISNGLLNDENLLIIAPTSSGKTLCAELAGVSKAMNKRPMVYLSPLVALTNTKYEEFKNKYANDLKIAIRVGMSNIDIKGEDLVILDSKIENADIICASYEAFDYLIRKGEYKSINNIGTIVIDEIQTLADSERGIELDGLISRLKIIYPNAQIIGLSATIANAREISEKLGLKPVIFNSRPVPVERHLILCKSNLEKDLNLIYLIKQERKVGASIIFTNSRYGTYKISKLFRKHKLNIPAYHSGLSYYERKEVERKIENNEISGVVATFALGAGVDLPVSQVIFYSMKMGNAFLDNNMFLQMSGRAGRYKRHKRGKVIILAELGLKSYGSEKTEDQIALSLLDGKEGDIIINMDPELVEAQVLASIASGLKFEDVERFYNMMISAEEEFNYLLKELYKKKMLNKTNNRYTISKLGFATAISFFIPYETLDIKRKLENNEDILNIAIELEYFTNIYLNNKLKDEMSRVLKVNIPSLFFTGMIFDLFITLDKIKGKISDRLLNSIIKWHENFSCEHEDRPYCDCGLLIANKKILELRLLGGTPKTISKYFEREYNIIIYPGDIFKFIDDIIHRLRGIRNISKALNYNNYIEKIERLIRNLERPENKV